MINVDSVGAKMFIHSYNAGDGMIKKTNKLINGLRLVPPLGNVMNAYI